MRWPLRNQIVVPMTAVLMATVLAVSVTTSFLAARRTRAELEQLFHDITSTVREARFPLTESVLLQMRGLSGAEFVLQDDQDRIVARTIAIPGDAEWTPPTSQFAEVPRFDQTISWDGRRYVHAAVKLPARGSSPAAQTLRLLYPEANYQRAWRDAVYPPLLIGAVALVAMTAVAIWIAGRVSRPLVTLHRQVELIAEGRLQPLPLPPRDDEVRDLSQSVNRLAQMLTNYESEVRRSERLRTLDQLGGGIAHQLRNAVTGCRLAVDLHLADCPLGRADESLDVAKRQLALMEAAIQKFLALGQSKTESPRQRLDLVKLVAEVVPLVAPAAKHAQVELLWSPPNSAMWVEADAGELEQVIVNLLLNGLDAVAACGQSGDSITANRWVGISCESSKERVALRVQDSGPGPSDRVRDQLFTPFVTDKPGGVGLGLATAREIARRHHGTLDWTRTAETTTFRLELPHARSDSN